MNAALSSIASNSWREHRSKLMYPGMIPAPLKALNQSAQRNIELLPFVSSAAVED